MGKKGSKRKTRWRILSIGASPGEEDEEEGLRNGYEKDSESDGAVRRYDCKWQSGYKPRRPGATSSGVGGVGGGGTSSSGYSSTGGSRSRHEDGSAGSHGQPRIAFNEDEYTRISTPRQDVLFKKGYLSRKKPSASNASTSATPSTTESQSASHSTADGSETTEDQQLLDCAAADDRRAVKPAHAQLGYRTFYDHASGYCYEYPVMLVGPAPMLGHVEPGVLATVPCGPVPLHPIEWINPAFVPKLASHQPFYAVDYQARPGIDCVPVMEEQEQHPLPPFPPMDASDGAPNENGTGSASCSVVGESDDQQQQQQQEPQQHLDEAGGVDGGDGDVVVVEHATPGVVHENGCDALVGTVGGYIEGPIVQQPIHVQHVIPAVPQHYMYPGHYMFGPSLINVNGVTVQSGPMIRTTPLPAADVAHAKRKKKKKKRKQRKLVVGNTEDEEEEDYSSECEDENSPSRHPWSGCPEPGVPIATTTATTTTTTTSTSYALNPECHEFQRRSAEPSTVGVGVGGGGEDSKEREVTSEETTTTAPSSETTSMSTSTTNRLSEDAGNLSGDSACEASRLSETAEDCSPTTVVGGVARNDETTEVARIGGEAVVDDGNVEKTSTADRLRARDDELVTVVEPAGRVPTSETNDKAELNDSDVLENKTECSNEDSGFESQSQGTAYPITEAVTEWLRRANSPDIFINPHAKRGNDGTADDAEGQEDEEGGEEEEEEEDETDEDEPPKNLQSNPMPALSVNNAVNDDDASSSRTVTCGEFARASNDARGVGGGGGGGGEASRRPTTARSRTGRKAAAAAAAASRRKPRRGAGRTGLAARPVRRDGDVVGDVCGLVEDDSVAGMRVASSSRMDSNRVDDGRTTVTRRRRRSGSRNKEDKTLTTTTTTTTAALENVDVKIRRPVDDDVDEGIVEDTAVRTFEKGEIVVSVVDGKLLPHHAGYELYLASEQQQQRERDWPHEIAEEIVEEVAREEVGEEVGGSSARGSLSSIDEPDVLECWEAETIEPLLASRRMMPSRGTSYDGEAAEDDAPNVHDLERVRRYYRLARELVDEEPGSVETRGTVPNSPGALTDSYCSEVLTGYEGVDERIPVDEAFEVYESCYNGKPTFLPSETGPFKPRGSLFARQNDGPIPCKAVCCNIQ